MMQVKYFTDKIKNANELGKKVNEFINQMNDKGVKTKGVIHQINQNKIVDCVVLETEPGMSMEQLMNETIDKTLKKIRGN